MSPVQFAKLLYSYRRTKRTRFTRRSALETHQQRNLQPFLDQVAAASPFYRQYAGKQLSAWPVIDRKIMMANFDRINTVGLTLGRAMAAAPCAEPTGRFLESNGGFIVTLSPGTSGERGVSVASADEHARWAGSVLARAMPEGIGRETRVALVMRSDSNLYQAGRAACVRFKGFDLVQPLEVIAAQLHAYRPDILVAPASVLAQIATRQLSGLNLLVRRVVSVAEILDPIDRALIQRAFRDPDELYQTTEGFFGSSCEHGIMHLHEEDCIVEQDWIDREARRFIPIVTDFRRITQPVIRYRLDDVLLARGARCPCKSAAIGLSAIDGWHDDQLRLPTREGGNRLVFSNVVARALARSLPPGTDYQLTQHGASTLTLRACISLHQFKRVRAELLVSMAEVGVDDALVQLVHEPGPPVPAKPGARRRRIVRKENA